MSYYDSYDDLSSDDQQSSVMDEQSLEVPKQAAPSVMDVQPLEAPSVTAMRPVPSHTPSFEMQPVPAHTPMPDTYEPGFWAGATKFGSELLDQIKASAGAAEKHLHEGNYPLAFHDIASPIIQPFEELTKMGMNVASGQPIQPPISQGQAKQEGVSQLASAVGLPAKGFQEAWQHKDYPGLAGQGASALATTLLLHKLGSPAIDTTARRPWEAPYVPPTENPAFGRDPITGELQSNRLGTRPASDFTPRPMSDFGFPDEKPKSSILPPAVVRPTVMPKSVMDEANLVEPGQDVVLPTADLTPEDTSKLASEGYHPVEHTPEGETVFRQSDTPPPDITPPPEPFRPSIPAPEPPVETQGLPDAWKQFYGAPEDRTAPSDFARGIMSQTADMRRISQLRNISEAPRGPVDLGPQPGMEDFRGILSAKAVGPFRQNDIIRRFDEGLPEARYPGDTRFILPNGKRLTHSFPEHEPAANSVGVGLDEAIQSGIIRVSRRFGGAEMAAPITSEQAAVLADMAHYNPDRTIFLDVNPTGNRNNYEQIRSKQFSAGTSASTIHSWVNSQFLPGEKGISSAYDPTIGADSFGQGNYQDMLRNSTNDQLREYARAMEANVAQLQSRVGRFEGRNVNQERMDKSRVTQAQRKLQQINEELTQRAGLPVGRGMKVEPRGISSATDSSIARNGISSAKGGVPQDEWLGMEIGDREDMLRNMQAQYSEHGARVANKELLQNAIDATNGVPGGKVSVFIDYKASHGVSPSITITDNGPGLNYDLIKNEYITLTGSGKRGKLLPGGAKPIGEMGVGKATYLLGADSFDITTVANEADGKWKYRIKGNAEDMIQSTTKLTKEKVSNSTPTGTKATVYDSDVANLDAAKEYLKTFAEYSNSPVEVDLKVHKVDPSAWDNYKNYEQVVQARTVGPGKQVGVGSGPGGNFRISVPDDAKWVDNTSQTTAILSNRGMFQGAQGLWLSGKGRLPDRVLVEIDPTVPATDGKLYPLTSPTRERMKDPFKDKVLEVVQRDLMAEAAKRQKEDIQAAFDNLAPAQNPLNPRQPLNFVVNDRGGRYTPQELNSINASPHLQGVANNMESMLNRLDALFPTARNKTIKFGFDLADNDRGGVNIPNLDPARPNQTAILINPFSALEYSNGDPKMGGDLMAHLILHEFNHNMVGSEGSQFTWQLAITDSKFGTENRANVARAIQQSLSGPDGNYAPEVLDLLQQHTAARGRPDTTVDFIARQEQGRFATAAGESQPTGGRGIYNARATKKPVQPAVPETPWNKFRNELGWGRGGTIRDTDVGKAGSKFIDEALGLSKAATTVGDYSATLKQGLPSITTIDFYKALLPMVKAGLSKNMSDAIMADIRSKPIFFRQKVRGKELPSYADKVGFKLIETGTDLSKRGEMIASNWIENGRFFGMAADNPIARAYSTTLGRFTRASNRAFSMLINHIGANRLEFLIDRAEDISKGASVTGRGPMPGVMGGFRLPEMLGGADIGLKQKYTLEQAAEMNPYKNLVLGKDIADFVKTAMGQAPLKTHLLPFKQAELSLEYATKGLTRVLFAPRLIASRVRMLNPNTYIMASPFVRKQYMKALISTALGWQAVTQMAQLSGSASVSWDMNSSDFGKMRIGNTRFDLGASFLPYLVAIHRLYSGKYKSSATGLTHTYGQGFQAETQWDQLERFGTNKLEPVTKFAYDLLHASEYQPFHVMDRALQLALPLTVQDIIEMWREDPSLLPVGIPMSILGAGTQTYEKGVGVGKIIPGKYDVVVKHPAGYKAMPWNWGKQ